MWMAYEDIGGIQIKDVPFEDPRPEDNISSLEKAQWVLSQAMAKRPDIHWVIVGSEPKYGVHGPMSAEEFERRLSNREQFIKVLLDRGIITHADTKRVREILDKELLG